MGRKFASHGDMRKITDLVKNRINSSLKAREERRDDYDHPGVCP